MDTGIGGWPWIPLLLGATGLHAGFQVTVSTLVYPMLVRTPPDAWRAVHSRHSRVITPVVAVVYGALVLTAVAALAVDPDGWVIASAAASATAVGVTATRAAPLHGRLSAYPEPELLRRLLRVDLVRTAAAVIALLAATGAVLARG